MSTDRDSSSRRQGREAMAADAEGFDCVFVIQHRDERFDVMPMSIALDWRREHGVQVAIYVMYAAVELLRDEALRENDELREYVDALLAEGVQIFACGFCSRACRLGAESYYPGIQVANRQIFLDLMQNRRPLYW